MIRIGAIIDMSRAEHARLRALHADFPERVAPWLELLEVFALSHRGRVDEVLVGLVGDLHAAGRIDGPAASWILAAFEERCEQERLGTTLLYEAQSNHGGTEDTEGAREGAA